MEKFPSSNAWIKIPAGLVAVSAEVLPSPNRGKGLPDMNLERVLCEAFCDGITVEKVPAGLVVATPFEDVAGDRLAFYVTPDKKGGFYRLEDDGSLVPTLIAMGTDVTEGQRARLFQAILSESGVDFDPSTGELRTAPLPEGAVAVAAIRFVSMLTRVAALSAMRPELVLNTFREDAIRRIKDELNSKVIIEERRPVSEALAEFEPDLVLRAMTQPRPPVAVFVAVSDARLYEAIFLKLSADYEVSEDCAVVALIEREDTRLVSNRMRQRAHNRLDAVPVYYGEESAAIARIAREAIPDFRAARFQ
jgi:hypothetical protein